MKQNRLLRGLAHPILFNQEGKPPPRWGCAGLARTPLRRTQRRLLCASWLV